MSQLNPSPASQAASGLPARRPRQKLEPGVNDLAATHPEVAALWDTDANDGLLPSQVLPGSNRKVWWRCEKGHRWESAPYTLTISGSRCPCCAGKRVIPGETDLATRYPDIAALWDAERNAEPPSQVMPATKKKYWWRCGKGHRWQAAVYSLTLLGSGCPYCSGHKPVPGETDLAARYPDIAALWDTERNDRPPTGIPPSSRATAWWRCEKGHRWQAQVHSVVTGRSCCPACAGRSRPRGEGLSANRKTSL